MTALPTPGLTCENCGDELAGCDQKRYCSRTCASTARSRKRLSDEAFWNRVNRGTPGGCWEWTGSVTAGGYGHLRRPGGTYDYSHRVAYELTRGSIPDGLSIDHLCRNRACCNPDHLEPVTTRTNVRRGMAPYGVRTKCRHGHDITNPENVYTAPKGDRRCRTCMDATNRQRNLREKASRQAASTRG